MRKIYQTPLALGFCADVDPWSEAAADILLALEDRIKTCNQIYCNSKVVRIAIYELDKGKSEFRGLCERHKKMGIWDRDQKVYNIGTGKINDCL